MLNDFTFSFFTFQLVCASYLAASIELSKSDTATESLSHMKLVQNYRDGGLDRNRALFRFRAAGLKQH
jgi:hypothetical protein